jgi:hypothetical protein
MIQNVINFSIIGNKKQKRELKNIIIAPHSYSINKEIINLEKCIGEGYNSYQEKSITNEGKRSLTSNMIKFMLGQLRIKEGFIIFISNFNVCNNKILRELGNLIDIYL